MTVSKDPRQIRGMFSAIAPRYDLLNHLLSLSIDRYWRRRSRRLLNEALGKQGRILDLCTGTADLALLLAAHHRVVGSDFAHPMLLLAEQKRRAAANGARLKFVEADALHLPFRDAVFDGVTIAFGLRNLVSYQAGLCEMARVVRAGGLIGILEFSEPRLPVFRQAYLLYFSRLLPKLGEWISGRPGAYSYLCRSVHEFPDEDELRRIIEAAGLREVRSHRFSGGIASFHLARK